MKLFAKSPSAYRLVQNVLVLPSDRTLRYEKIKIMNNCQVGIQNGVITRITRAVKSSKNHYDQLAVLCIDEMTIKGGSFFWNRTEDALALARFLF